jgi:predicted nucleotidyltransferase
MARKKISEVTQSITKFVNEVGKEIFVEKVFLFGSQLHGKPHIDSDIDLIVVSPDFARGRYIKHIQYLFQKAASIDARIEAIPASPEELSNLDHRTFLAHAVKSGKIVYSRRKKIKISK